MARQYGRLMPGRQGHSSHMRPPLFARRTLPIALAAAFDGRGRLLWWSPNDESDAQPKFSRRFVCRRLHHVPQRLACRQPTCSDLRCHSKGAHGLRLEGRSRTVAIICPRRNLGSIRLDGVPIRSGDRVIILHHCSWRTRRDFRRRPFLPRGRNPLASIWVSHCVHLDSAATITCSNDRFDDSCCLGKLLGALPIHRVLAEPE